MKNIPRLTKERWIRSFEREFHRKTPDSIIEMMKALKEEYPDRDIFLVEHECSEYAVWERVVESDVEYENRLEVIKLEKKRKRDKAKAKKDAEYAEYVRLKQKFEG